MSPRRVIPGVDREAAAIERIAQRLVEQQGYPTGPHEIDRQTARDLFAQHAENVQQALEGLAGYVGVVEGERENYRRALQRIADLPAPGLQGKTWREIALEALNPKASRCGAGVPSMGLNDGGAEVADGAAPRPAAFDDDNASSATASAPKGMPS